MPAREASPFPWSVLLPLLENEDGEKESLKSPGCLPSLPPSLCCPVAVPEVPLLTPPLGGREGDGRGREIDARGLSEEGDEEEEEEEEEARTTALFGNTVVSPSWTISISSSRITSESQTEAENGGEGGGGARSISLPLPMNTKK